MALGHFRSAGDRLRGFLYSTWASVESVIKNWVGSTGALRSGVFRVAGGGERGIEFGDGSFANTTLRPGYLLAG